MPVTKLTKQEEAICEHYVIASRYSTTDENRRRNYKSFHTKFRNYLKKELDPELYEVALSFNTDFSSRGYIRKKDDQRLCRLEILPPYNNMAMLNPPVQLRSAESMTDNSGKLHATFPYTAPFMIRAILNHPHC